MVAPMVWKLASIMTVAVCLSSVLAASADEQANQEPIQINKIYWCIHPYCWSLHGGNIPEGYEPELFKAVLGQEQRVHQLHMDFVSNMKPDEALIIYPIGSSEPMTNLTAHAEETLGRRLIISCTRYCANADFLTDVPDPIRAFLNDDELEGKQQWVQDTLTDKGTWQTPEGLAEEMEAEIREACETIGYDWGIGAFKLIYYNRVLALDIEEKFRDNGLVYDPETVECMAFGEGLEQCAMSWKSMLRHYMGLAKPIENDPSLSVSGAAYLVNAEFKERVLFADDVRLLLWEGEDSRPIGLFYRTATQLKDPQLYAHLPIEGLNLEVWVMNDKFWSAQAPTAMPPADLHVPVFTADRTGRNAYYYLIGSDISFEDFRERLAGVEIDTEAR